MIMSKKNKKKKTLKEFCFEYPVTEKVIHMETPQEEWQRKTKDLRNWAKANMKETAMVLLVYGIWGLLFSYAYSRGGVETLAISLGVALIYKIDRLVAKK